MSMEALLRRKKRLIALLKDPDTRVRLEASKALEQVEMRVEAETIIGQLESGEPLKRARAMQILPYLKDKRVLGALMKALFDPSEEVQCMAARALGLHGRVEAAASLSNRIKSTDSTEVMGESVRSLGLLKDRTSLPLLEALLKHPNRLIVLATLDALSMIGDSAAEEAVGALFDHADRDIRLAAIRALGELDLGGEG